MNSLKQNVFNKLPEITLLFWIMKICATTLGETAGDLFSMTLNIGYALSSIVLVGIFLVTLITQLKARKFHPLLYWTVILSTSTAGTTMSDFMDRTLHFGYAKGSLVLITGLITTLVIWYLTEKSLSVNNVKTPRAELFYWIAILFSNTLGTAFGDFLADNSGLGFLGGATLVSGVLLVIVLLHYYTKVSSIVLFWLAFVLTRPFGATFGDLLTKVPAKGGLGFGTIGSSVVLVTILGILIIYSIKKHTEPKKLLILD